MKPITTLLVVLSYALIFLSVSGLHIDIGPEGPRFLWGSILLHLGIFFSTMMIGPYYYKKSLTGENINQRGRTFCFRYALGVLALYTVIDIIIMGGIYRETIENMGENLGYTFLFYYINSRTLFSGEKKETKPSEKALSALDEKPESPPSSNSVPAKEASPRPVLFCRECGEKLLSDSMFCHKCGTKVLTVTEVKGE